MRRLRVVATVLAAGVLVACGSEDSVTEPVGAGMSNPTATTTPTGDSETAQRFLEESIQLALRAETGHFLSTWRRTTDAETLVEYLFGEFDASKGRWQAHVSTDPEIKYGGRPTTDEVHYGSGRLYTSDTIG